LQHGEAAISVWRYATTSQFWFESMQNCQSEFIAVAAIVGPLMVDSDRGRAELVGRCCMHFLAHSGVVSLAVSIGARADCHQMRSGF
jgi:hypothetical protein